MGAAGLVSTSWASVQGRRRELAVVRALGFDRLQVRRSVRVQGVVATLGALLVGVPVGVLVGRLLWRSFAESLGVLPDSPGPTGPILVTVTAALFLAVIASVVPGRLATRATPAADLRSE
jgi:ABC-type antimicrobial peptide transport system permease subunit